MKRRTKIVCTIGPAVNSKSQIAKLIKAGMNVARINCSHGDWESRRQWIKWIRELSPNVAPVAILCDLQGPKFRIGEISGGQTNLRVGEVVTVGPDPTAAIPVFQEEMVKALGKNARVLLGDGLVELKLGEAQGSLFLARVMSSGVVKSRQGFTMVGKAFDTPAMTDKDREDALEAAKADADFIALSYVNDPSDIELLRNHIKDVAPDIKLCAKIETREAIKNLDSIIKASDAVMVARGDMGLQLDIEDVPLAQKRIISKCNEAGKPVITATQMLESMLVSPRPTRAEVADIANAILDGTDAVMLSGETATGQYPIEAVETMAKVAEEAETIFNHEAWRSHLGERIAKHSDATEAVAYAVAQLAASTKPKAILTTTTSGQTARLVSKYRPKTPILCATWDFKVFRQMALVWGVEAIHVGLPSMTDELVWHSINGFRKSKRLKLGDQVIVTAGVPAGIPGNTNLILIETVREHM